MDENEVKHVVEAALLAAGRPLSLEKLTQLFTDKGLEIERATIRSAIDALGADYEGRGTQIKEVASGYRIQVRAAMHDWLQPLWEERAPRYTRALLETLALIAYRQPITRAEIEEVRGVAVSTNIVRTLVERGWVRVVGYRDVPGKPSMLGTTREFLDYFGLKKLEDLPPLADIRDGLPELSPQSDFLDSLDVGDLPDQVEVPIAAVPDAPADLESPEPAAQAAQATASRSPGAEDRDTAGDAAKDGTAASAVVEIGAAAAQQNEPS